MKLIDYVCEECGKVVEDWDDCIDSAIDGGCLYIGLKRCECGKLMTQKPWMNNKLPTCGVK